MLLFFTFTFLEKYNKQIILKYFFQKILKIFISLSWKSISKCTLCIVMSLEGFDSYNKCIKSHIWLIDNIKWLVDDVK